MQLAEGALVLTSSESESFFRLEVRREDLCSGIRSRLWLDVRSLIGDEAT